MLLAAIAAPASESVKPNEPKPAFPRHTFTVLNGGQPEGPATRILTDLLEKAPRKHVAIDDLYRRYKTECSSGGKQPLPPVEFAENVGKFCARVGIKMAMIKGKAHLMHVRVVPEPGVEPLAGLQLTEER